MRYINAARVVAAQMTSPADNPLVTDDSRLIEVWFGGETVRRQLFRKVKRSEQEAFVATLLHRGHLQSGNLLIAPSAVLFAEMENELLGGLLTIGFGEDGKPVELKVKGRDFVQICTALAGAEG